MLQFIRILQTQNLEQRATKLVVVYNPELEVLKKELNFEKEIESNQDIGYSLIYHNTAHSSEEVVRKYYDKEMVERAFKQIKGVLSLRPILIGNKF